MSMPVRSTCRCTDVAGTSPRCVPPARSINVQRFRREYSQQLSCISPRLNTVNAAAALPLELARQWPRTQPTANHKPTFAGPGIASDILGLGQAIVDWSSSVSDEDLTTFGVQKGARRVITVDERADVMATLDELGAPSQVSAGGSLANTLVGVAKLSRAAGKDLRVALGGSLGSDNLGQFFNSQMRSAGVRCVLDAHHHHHHHSHSHHETLHHEPHPTSPFVNPHSARDERTASPACSSSAPCASSNTAGGHTGTVMVLTTPDAQRSFLSFFTSETLTLSEHLRAAVRSSQMVVVEGYLWEMPGAEAYISAVLDAAAAAGVRVAMTAGDAGVVSRHREEILRVIARGVDLLFTNEEEAAALVGLQPGASAAYGEGCGVKGTGLEQEAAEEGLGARAARELARLCPLAVVTAGCRGSYVCSAGEVHTLPPHWLPQGPVDTCGAGDAYAAGWLYSQLAGYDVRTSGEFASRVASAVIGRYGPHLSDEDAEALVQQLPGHMGPVRVGLDTAAAVSLGAGGFADF